MSRYITPGFVVGMAVYVFGFWGAVGMIVLSIVGVLLTARPK